MRHGTEADGAAVCENFTRTHGETDYLLPCPEENTSTPLQESAFLKKQIIPSWN